MSTVCVYGLWLVYICVYCLCLRSLAYICVCCLWYSQPAVEGQLGTKTVASQPTVTTLLVYQTSLLVYQTSLNSDQQVY